MKTKVIIYIILLALYSCSQNEYEHQAWEIAENSVANKKEMIRFLEHYKSMNDKEKYEAACFLISNITGKYSSGKALIYDVDIVQADSLITSLEESFVLRKSSSFLKNYSFKQFLEYILPYRISNEPLEYYWKLDCKHRFAIENTGDMIEVAKQINTSVKLNLSPENYRDLPHSYSSMIHTGYGKCNDRSNLLVMALRAAGIPSAYEFVPYWGSSNNGHSFVSVILPDGKIYPLQNTDQITDDSYLSRKTPKIYRRMYGLQDQRWNSSDVPELLRNHDLLDVTELHSIQSCEVKIAVDEINSNGMYYLSVFSPSGWIPVAFSTFTKFLHVGTGTKMESEDSKEAMDLGDGILYLPSRWKEGEVIPVGNPIVVSNNFIREIIADSEHSEKVILKRKYPLNTHIVDFAKLMVTGIFEGANKADFSDAEEIYKITETPESQMQRVKISSPKAYRYLRYKRPGGTFSIAELSFCHPDGRTISFRPIACEALMGDSTMLNIFDRKPVTYYQLTGGIDLWVGVDLYKPIQIGFIEFAPRNDDNAIAPNDIYEVFYWKDGWNSLGVKKAESDVLIYENVPENALLWLRNLIEGYEERPFTYEKGKQIWW